MLVNIHSTFISSSMKKLCHCDLILSFVLFLFDTGTGINSEYWSNGNTIAAHRGND